MITIIHGDNTILSRNQLNAEIEKRERAGKKIRSLSAADITLAVLTEALQSTSLFGDENVLVLERIFKMRAKTLLNQVIAILTAQSETEVILWEGSSIAAANLKLLADVQPNVIAFKTSPLVFSAIDLFGNPREKHKLIKQLHAAYDQDTPEFVFSMLASRVRQLIKVAEGNTAEFKPYPLQKLRQQAQFFPLEKLRQVHRQLLEIDLTQKLSTSLLSLEQQLDLLALQTSA